MKLKKYEQEKKVQYNCLNLNLYVNVNKNLNFPTMHVNVNEKSKGVLLNFVEKNLPILSQDSGVSSQSSLGI